MKPTPSWVTCLPTALLDCTTVTTMEPSPFWMTMRSPSMTRLQELVRRLPQQQQRVQASLRDDLDGLEYITLATKQRLNVS